MDVGHWMCAAVQDFKGLKAQYPLPGTLKEPCKAGLGPVKLDVA